MSQFADDLKVFFYLSDGHLIERRNLQVRLISVGLAQCLATVDQEESQTDQPEPP